MVVATRQRVDQSVLVELRRHDCPTPREASALEPLGIHLLSQSRLFCLEGFSPDIRPEQLTVLFDPALETVCLRAKIAFARSSGVRGEASGLDYEEFRDKADECEEHQGSSVDVFCRPGVTDAEGETAAVALSHTGPSVRDCRAGRRFHFAGTVGHASRPVIERALGNPLIHSFIWSDQIGLGHLPEELTSPWEPQGQQLYAADSPADAETVEVRGLDDEALIDISRWFNLSLDAHEMRAIADHFEVEGRPPTDVELQSLALTWSEHCCHKTFKATIEFESDGTTEIIPGLLRSCIVDPSAQVMKPWIHSAFEDNAGIVSFNRDYDLAFKVETHNHPSALEPYGGAHTGVGGVIRDVLGVSAEPIANTDVLCFGPSDMPAHEVPADVFHPLTTLRGVVRGVSDYGNNMGIPTVAGAVLFNPGYTSNPLVFCGTVGILPRGSHPTRPQPGDAVVLLGGRTGRDGLHGATMSSSTLDRQSVAGTAVQIGAPITEKKIRDVLPKLRDEQLYNAITDCGAGGLCSAVGEMAADLGVDVDLSLVPLKYEGLSPWEIWLSEAQERMVLSVSKAALPRLRHLCDLHDVEVSSLGSFRSDGKLRLWHGPAMVCDLEMEFLHAGKPARVLHARKRSTTPPGKASSTLENHDWATILARLLAHPNIRSKEAIIRRYDHEVQAGTVHKPLTGRAGPSDAAVLRPIPESWRGVVLAHGINPLYGELDPHAMSMLAVDEALRNLVAVGGSIDRAVLVDNFCWGAVDDPEELGSLVRAAQGCRDATLAFRVPFITGKDSLRNTSVHGRKELSIPGTVLISALGVIPDIRRTVTMDLKREDSALFLLGDTHDEMGASHYCQVTAGRGGLVPQVRKDETSKVMRALTLAIRCGLVQSCHDLSEGGLAVAAAEMAIAGGLGLEIDVAELAASADRPEVALFAESPGRFLVEVSRQKISYFHRRFSQLPIARIGRTTASECVVLRRGDEALVDLRLADLDRCWRGGLTPEDPPVLGSSAVTVTRARERKSTSSSGRPVKALVLSAAGTNCDRETLTACRLAGADAERVHLNELVTGTRKLLDFSFLILPGGFSYGDHLGAGSMLATLIKYRLQDDLQRFVAAGRPVLGICNGFQTLLRLGLLGDASLTTNASQEFDCRWVALRVEPSGCIFLRGLEELELPIAHGEGRVVLPASPAKPFADVKVSAPLRYRHNPNGSAADIAGISNEQGNVFGLMPHPERFLNKYHHPRWQRQTILPPFGLRLFENAVAYARTAL